MPEDERFRAWEDYYLRTVIDEDTHLITRWQSILDTLLVYVCFLPRNITNATGWLSRYQRSLTETRLTIHERSRRRHGLMDWGLSHLIEFRP